MHIAPIDHRTVLFDKNRHFSIFNLDMVQIIGQSFTLFNIRYHILNKHSEGNATKFSCDVCPQKFLTNGKLKTHVRLVHERVKCEICHQEICNFFMLKRHKAKVHGIKPSNVHQCDHCTLFFTNKICLDKHIVKKHQQVD